MANTELLRDDQQVVQACLAGDADALRLLVGRFRDTVYRLSFRILRHHEDAEDIVQETFSRVFRSLEHWDQKRPLKPWVMTIAVNRCRTALAKRSRSVVLSRQEVTEVAQDHHVDLKARREMAEELDLQLNGLKPQLKECFQLFYREQLSIAEISQQIGYPEGTVKTWLHRARQQLAEGLKRREQSLI